MKISILLPYKENYSPNYPGAVSLSINDTQNHSKYKNNSTIFGNTEFKKKLSNNYINVVFEKKLFTSKNKSYVEKFIDLEKKNNSDLIEIHNRPIYIKYLKNKLSRRNYFLYFHNDPLQMSGSKTIKDRLYLINTCKKLIFNSNWSKNQFIKNIDIKNSNLYKNMIVIHQSTKKNNVNLNSKQNIISFVGKLNYSKGYDLFCKSVIPILEKYKNWKAIVCGDEERTKLNYNHNRLIHKGFVNHNKVINILKKTSIAVACSRWEEPFGRSSLEAAANGCLVIISNKGGLPETITDGITLKNLTEEELFKIIEKFILDKKLRNTLQRRSLKNFYLTNAFASEKIDKLRSDIANSKFVLNYSKKRLKIINIYNVGQKAFHRLYNISIGKKFTNGFIRNNHDVLEISDRDYVRNLKTINYISHKHSFKDYMFNTINNYNPDLIIFGHSDNITAEILSDIKEKNQKILISHWNEDPMMKSVNDSINNLNKISKFNDLVDHSFVTTDPSILLKRDNQIKNLSFFFVPVDRNIEFNKVYNLNHKYDLFYAMSHGVNRGILKKGKIDERVIFLNKLIPKLINIKYDFYGYNKIEPIWGNDFYNAIRNSKMGLNLSRGKPTKYYTSNRIASLIGNGLLTFIDRKTQLDDFFKKDEVIFYNSIEELASKINFYKKHKKTSNIIASNGRKKYFKSFNEKRITEYLINKLLGKKDSLL